MKKILILLIGLVFGAPAAIARDTIAEYSVEEALALAEAKLTIGTEVNFYFGAQAHPKVLKTFGEFRTNKKTNAFNKSDKEACQWVFLSAIKALQQRALREGGNAVINIRSNYKNNLTSSNDSFRCGAGAIMAGVALVGDVVKVER